MSTEKEYICQLCGEYFPATRIRKYCSEACREEASRSKTWADRLHDGMRLLSDDYGELDDDESVTFQK